MALFVGHQDESALAQVAVDEDLPQDNPRNLRVYGQSR
jgi:hypothetical protein